MVSLADSQIHSSLSSSSSRIQRSHHGRSMRTIRSNLFVSDRSCATSPPDGAPSAAQVGFSGEMSENLSDSVVDLKLRELATAAVVCGANAVGSGSRKLGCASAEVASELLEISRDFSDYSSFNSDISGELQRLASLPRFDDVPQSPTVPDLEALETASGIFPRLGTLSSSEVLESASLENVDPIVRTCVGGLASLSIDVKRAAAARLRLLAKHRSDFRSLIANAGAIPALVTLLRSTDPATQENAVTALLNLSLEEENKGPITAAGAIKPLVYALRTGTAVAKQNAACALLSLSLIEDNRATIGACGAIPPLVALLVGGTSRGKKDALTTLYKLCSVRRNKERALSAGAAAPLVDMIGEHGGGTAEKAMVVLGSLAAIPEGKEAIVEAGGISTLVEAIEAGPSRGREFAVNALLLLCTESHRNRGLLVREGAIPPLVALSQSGSARAKHKAETLLRYLREQRHEGGGMTPSKFR